MRTKGFIFAAGLGTRLKPLTERVPKALVKLDGKPLIDHVVEKFVGCGITDITVNVHHFPDLIIEHLRNMDTEARFTISDERAFLRDTAGGLKFAMPFLSGCDSVLLYNVDIISDIDLGRLIDFHRASGNDATLAVRHRETSRYFTFDRESMRLTGWLNKNTGERIGGGAPDREEMMAFSGIHVINTSFAEQIPTVEKCSFTRFYLEKYGSNKICAFVHDGGNWFDVGKFEQFRDRLS